MNRFLGSVLNRLAAVAPGGASLRPQLQRWRGVSIGKNVWLGQYVYIDDLHPSALTIGDNCTIGIRSTILTHFYWGPKRPTSNGRVVIERDVYVGPNCVILPNVRIGEGAVIKAGTVVSRSVPPRTFWGEPSAGPLATITVPLTSAKGYEGFLAGLRPLRRDEASTGKASS